MEGGKSKSEPGTQSLIIVAFIGALFSVMLYFWVDDWEQRRFEEHFQADAESYIAAIRNEFRRHYEVVNSVANFLRSNDEINRAAFGAFVSAVVLEHNDTQALKWAPRVTHAERDRYEKKANEAGLSNFRFTQQNSAGELVTAAQREEYFPVYYLGPHAGNQQMQGYDLASNQVRRITLEQARDSGEVIISGPIALLQGTDKQHGYLMLKPIYRGDDIPPSREQRRQRLEGYALGLFRYRDFFDEALEQRSGLSGRQLSMQVSDINDTGERVLLYSHLSGDDSEWLGKGIDDDQFLTIALSQYGREWQFTFRPTVGFAATGSTWRSWLVLLTGAGLTVVILLLVYRERRYSRETESRAEQLAQEKFRSEQRYQHLFDSNNDALFVVEIGDAGPGRFLDVNRAMCHKLGYSREELLKLGPIDINLPGMEEELQKCVQHVLQHKDHLFETVHITSSGEQIPVEINIRALDEENGSPFIGCARDVTSRLQAHEEQIEVREREMVKLSSALEQTADSVMITDRQGVIEYVNPAFEKVTGYSREEACGKTPVIINSGLNGKGEYERLWLSILRGDVYQNVLINRKKDGSLYYEEKTISPLKDSNGEITHFISSGKDITERMQTEERLHHLVNHDILTDLPNKALFMERLNNAISQARGIDQRCAVLFIDLDRFKNINDTLGHTVGDLLLQAVPDRLRSCVRDRDVVARFGGDEFAVLLEKIPNSEAVAKVAAKLVEVLEKPYQVGEQDLYLSASIGISLSPDDSSDANTLIKHADTAMYRVKDTGRNSYQFYSTEMGVRAFERLSLETSLRYALERGEYELYFQPQIEMKSATIVGAEALLRWQHPELGLITPDKFIPLLEDTGLIIDVGEWVLDSACRQGKVWDELTERPFRMAVNLSGKQFRNESLIETISKVVANNGFNARQLDVEITETVLMQDDRVSLANIGGLKELGVQLSIDDFGTGYSSLSYLKRFPVDSIKIDRTFIRDVTTDPEDAAIVTAVIAMAHSLKLEVIAEGVEEESQVEFLSRYDCDLLQGYLYGRPLPQNEFRALLLAKKK